MQEGHLRDSLQVFQPCVSVLERITVVAHRFGMCSPKSFGVNGLLFILASDHDQLHDWYIFTCLFIMYVNS